MLAPVEYSRVRFRRNRLWLNLVSELSLYQSGADKPVATGARMVRTQVESYRYPLRPLEIIFHSSLQSHEIFCHHFAQVAPWTLSSPPWRMRASVSPRNFSPYFRLSKAVARSTMLRSGGKVVVLCAHVGVSHEELMASLFMRCLAWPSVQIRHPRRQLR